MWNRVLRECAGAPSCAPTEGIGCGNVGTDVSLSQSAINIRTGEATPAHAAGAPPNALTEGITPAHAVGAISDRPLSIFGTFVGRVWAAARVRAISNHRYGGSTCGNGNAL